MRPAGKSEAALLPVRGRAPKRKGPAGLVIAPGLASFTPSQYATASRRTNLQRRRSRPKEDASHFPLQKMV